MANELATGGLTEGASFDSPLFECENFIVTPDVWLVRSKQYQRYFTSPKAATEYIVLFFT